MKKAKVNHNLRGKDLILDYLRVLRHYKEALSSPFKYSRFNRFQIERYYDTLQEDFRLFLRLYKFNRKYGKIS